MRPPIAPVPLAPQLRAVPFLKAPDAETIRLTDRQRQELTRIGTRVRLPARMVIYHADSPAEWVFSVAEGAVKSYRELPSGRRAVCAFLFVQDLFGLAQSGRYVNTAQAITGVTLYRLPVNELAVLLRHDGDLQFHFLGKVTHELRESQRRSIIINRRDAAGRLAMFIVLMREHTHGSPKNQLDVPLPMTRSDIADFLGLSLETVSRAAAELERRRLVAFEQRHLARIMDPARLARVAAAV